MSVALQSAAVLLLFTLASTKVAPQKIARFIPIFDPEIAAYQPKTAGGHEHRRAGGGGDRSALPASKGALPKFSPKPFTPPAVVANNLAPRLTIDPAILPPDVVLPQVNMAQYGDPLQRIGPPSNGNGSGGGIGSGDGGGVGSGHGGSAGPGDGDGGFGPAVWRVGSGGVSAPALLFKVEPEYSEEARKAKYQGTVLLSIVVDASGKAQNIRVARSLGLGLDEKAIEAVRKWKFKPGYKDGRPVAVVATIEVNFRLL
jgi:TonB family protein